MLGNGKNRTMPVEHVKETLREYMTQYGNKTGASVFFAEYCGDLHQISKKVAIFLMSAMLDLRGAARVEGPRLFRFLARKSRNCAVFL